MSIATTRDCGSRLAIRARSSQYSPLDGNVSSVRCLYRPHRELQRRMNRCLHVRCVQCTVFPGTITKCRGTDPLYGRVEVWLHSFFTSALDRGEWSALHSGRLAPAKRNPSSGLCGPRSQAGCFAERKFSFLARYDPSFLCIPILG